MEISFAKGWTPDLPEDIIAASGGLYTAKNIIPVPYGYKAVNSPRQLLDELISDNIYDDISIEGSDSVRRTYLAAGKNIIRVSESGLISINAFSNEPDIVSLCNYGDLLLATNAKEPVKVLNITNESAGFTSLEGNPPQAKYILFFKGHIILGNLVEESITYPKRIRWCARENITDWQPSLTTGADYQDFPDADGEIKGIAQFGDNIAIFFEKSITIGNFSGGIYTFNFQINAIKNIGCFYPKSIISIGDSVYFWSSEGIYRLNSSGLVDISQNRIKNTIFNMIDSSKIYNITGCYDRNEKIIYWSLPSLGYQYQSYILCYSLINDAFTLISLDHKYLFTGYSSPKNIDLYENILIDEWGDGIDIQSHIASIEKIYLINEAGYLNDLSGPALGAEIETGDYGNYPDILTARRLYLFFNSPFTGFVSPKHRYGLSDMKNVKGIYSIKPSGECDFLVSNRFLSFKIALSNFNKLESRAICDIVKRGER